MIKMNLKKAYFPLFLLVLLFVACSKQKSFEAPDADESFIPHLDSATWHYEDTTLNQGFTLRAIDSTKTEDGISFNFYENIPDDETMDTSYTLIGISDGDYYVKSLLSILGDEKLLILKQNGKVGDQWTVSIPLEDFGEQDFIFQIKEKNTSHEVLGQSFSKVVHVKISAKVPTDITGGDGMDFVVPVGDLYFASGIGIIQLNVNNPFDNSLSVGLLLTDYDIPK